MTDIVEEGAPASAGASASTATIQRELALFLATSPVDSVTRHELRQTLPEGQLRPRGSGRGTQNNVGGRLRDALRLFERQGLVVRDEDSVLIIDRAALYTFATTDRRVDEGP